MNKIESILRDKRFWISVVPLAVVLISIVVTQSYTSPIGALYMIGMGIVFFPIMILGSTIGSLFSIRFLDGGMIVTIVLVALVYAMYYLFITKVEKLKKHLLYIFSMAIILAILLGIQGCASFIGSF